MTWAYLQMMAALAAVTALIYAAAHFMKKRQSGGGRRMRIEEYLAMGPRKGIAAVRVGAEVFIIGVTPNDFRLLKAIPGADFAVDAGAASSSSRAPIDAGGRTSIDAGGRTPTGSFSDALRSESAGGAASKSAAFGSEEHG
jgi:flagellar biogenesis protein FliO